MDSHFDFTKDDKLYVCRFVGFRKSLTLTILTSIIIIVVQVRPNNPLTLFLDISDPHFFKRTLKSDKPTIFDQAVWKIWQLQFSKFTHKSPERIRNYACTAYWWGDRGVASDPSPIGAHSNRFSAFVRLIDNIFLLINRINRVLHSINRLFMSFFHY